MGTSVIQQTILKNRFEIDRVESASQQRLIKTYGSIYRAIKAELDAHLTSDKNSGDINGTYKIFQQKRLGGILVSVKSVL